MNMNDVIVIFNNLIIFYTIIILTIFCINIITSSILHSEKNKKDKEIGAVSRLFVKDGIFVSLLVPAFNEEEVIVDTILSQSKLDYTGYEIIVINDGSQDRTRDMVIEAFQLEAISYRPAQQIKTQEVRGVFRGLVNGITLTLIDKENGGKSDALNAGINMSRYPLFVAMDADCIIKSDAISKLVFPVLMNKKTIAVGGNVKISNHLKIVDGEIVSEDPPKGFFVIFQILEYMRAFQISRLAWSKYKSNVLISGAFGLFRKDRVIEVGGYRTDTVGEDMELVIRLNLFQIEQKREYYIVNEERAYCFTQAPDNRKDFMSQRVRWHIGLIQSLFIHRRALFNPRYRRIGLFGLSYYMLFELLSAVIEVTGYLAIVGAIILGLYNYKMFLFLTAVVFTYCFFVTISAMIFEGYSLGLKSPFKDKLKLIVFSIFEPVTYRQYCNFIRIFAMVRYPHYKNKWNKIKRKEYKKD